RIVQHAALAWPATLEVAARGGVRGSSARSRPLIVRRVGLHGYGRRVRIAVVIPEPGIEVGVRLHRRPVGQYLALLELRPEAEVCGRLPQQAQPVIVVLLVAGRPLRTGARAL